MKKLLLAVVAAGLLNWTGVGFAEETTPVSPKLETQPAPSTEMRHSMPKVEKKKAIERLTGVIVSVDTVKNEVVVKDSKSGHDRTLNVDPKILATLKVEEKVKITIKSGTNSVESIRVIKPQKK